MHQHDNIEHMQVCEKHFCLKIRTRIVGRKKPGYFVLCYVKEKRLAYLLTVHLSRNGSYYKHRSPNRMGLFLLDQFINIITRVMLLTSRAVLR